MAPGKAHDATISKQPASLAAVRKNAPPASGLISRRLWPHQLADASVCADSWLWHGYLGPGKMTLLVSQWKTGKTTLLGILMARMAQGGEVAGLPVAPGKAAVITEEGPETWDKRCRKLGIGAHVSLFCRPFHGRPTPDQWRDLVETLLELRRDEGLDLVAIDPLAAFLPTGNENSAAAVMDCLLPLQALTAAGLCVLLLHHPRKGTTQAGQASRGSGALPSHADILVEMKWYGNPYDEDRRRWLRAFTRDEATRRTLLVELTAAGDDYLVHDGAGDEVLVESNKVLYLVLEDARNRLTQRQILKQWPRDFPRPDQSTIARGLARGLADGSILRQGSGRRRDPYRYYLPAREDELYPKGASDEEQKRFMERWKVKFFEGLSLDVPRPAAQPPAEAGDDAKSTLPAAAPPHETTTPNPSGQEQGRAEAAPATETIPPAAPPPPAEPGLLTLLAQMNAKVDWKKARRLPP